MQVISRLAIVFALLLASWAAVSDGLTFDESSHITCGLSHLETGDFRLSGDHPPLARMWLALPHLFVSHRSVFNDEVPGASAAWERGNYFFVAKPLFCDANRPETFLLPSRAMALMVFAATLVCIYAFAKKEFGESGALVSTLLAAFSPTMLAHGHLATLDMSAALTTLLTLVTFARMLERDTVISVVAAGLCLGAGFVTKYSGLLIPPALLIMALVVVRRNPIRVIILTGGSFLVAWLVIWATYGFSYSPFNPPSPQVRMMGSFETQSMDEAWHEIFTNWKGFPYNDLSHTFLAGARKWRLLPEAYLFGVTSLLKSGEQRPAYLNGTFSTSGWRAYFPMAFALKSTLPELLLVALGVVLSIWQLLKRKSTNTLLLGALSFAIIYWSASIFSNLNIGIRHLLPLYPLMFIFSGSCAAFLTRRFGGALVGLLLVAHCAVALAYAPRYISFFNEFAGGPAGGLQYLADSNIDWGQDLKRLRDLDPGAEIHVAALSSVPPACIDPKWHELYSFLHFGPGDPLVPGIYASSANQLIGLYFSEARDSFWTPAHWKIYRELRAWESIGWEHRDGQDVEDAKGRLDYLKRALLIKALRARAPDQIVGDSVYVYRVSGAELDDAFSIPEAAG